VNEAQWTTCTDPQKMLKFLQGKISIRKLRLFGAACCHRIWHLLPDERSRRGVEVAERFADGLVTQAEAEAAGNAAAEVSGYDLLGIPAEVGWRAVIAAPYLLPLPAEAWQLRAVWEYVAVALEAEQLVKEGATPEMLEAWADQSVESGRAMGWTAIDPDAIIASILREVIGPVPFRRVLLEPAILLWNGGTIPSMAQGIYDNQTFDGLPLLGDALEEAGCTDAGLLGHLRGPGPHVRGCWVLDLLTGRER
jgi:hypothetical protein